MIKRFFVTGISTDVGKTVTSAAFVAALRADYWKPVQAGEPGDTDSHRIKKFCGDLFHPVIHKERYLLKLAMSPHAAAALEGIVIERNAFTLPSTQNNLIVEGAGGFLVPLHDSFLIADLAKDLGLPVIVVSRHYLGSISHTLLTIEAIKARNLPIAGIVFNGAENQATETVIVQQTGVKMLGRIPEEKKITPQFILEQGQKLTAAL